MTTRRLTGVALAVALTIAATGCGDGRALVAPRTVSVSGQVLYKGKPAEGVKVALKPKFESVFLPSGVTDKAGKFVLSTAAASDGAPPGEYVVVFEKLQTITNKQGLEEDVDAWKGKYANPETSKHRVQIDGQAELAPFLLD